MARTITETRDEFVNVPDYLKDINRNHAERMAELSHRAARMECKYAVLFGALAGGTIVFASVSAIVADDPWLLAICIAAIWPLIFFSSCVREARVRKAEWIEWTARFRLLQGAN
jgi:hypothetical protein